MKTRLDIIKKYGKGKSVVELGVYAGTFSKQIWHEAKPSELWLVDPWVGSGHCGNDDGTQTDYCADLEEYYLDVRKYFTEILGECSAYGNTAIKKYYNKEEDREVNIYRGRSYEFLEYQGLACDIYEDVVSNFDLIYIDADHDPRAVLVDLAMSRIAIKYGGYVSGHDYLDGIKSAVDWFCQTMGYKVFSTTEDKIPSFYFKVEK